jgi:ABC-2 type transport system permease protein
MTATMRIARHELVQLLRDRAVRVAALVFLLAAAWAGHHGGQVADRLDDERRAVHADRAEVLDAMAAVLRGEARALPARAAKLDPRKAFDIGRGPEPATLPARPTGALAVGASDLLPVAAAASLYTRTRTEADKRGPDSPVVRTGGHADLAFVIVFLLPLIVLVLSHDLLSAERARGTLALIRAQGVALGAVVLGKVIARGAVVAVLVLLAVVIGAVFGGVDPGLPGTLAGLAAWVGLGLAYAGFYLAAAVWIESRSAGSASSARTALALGALWVATTLVLPVLASASVGALRPLPSRIEAIDAERSAQLDRRRDGDRLLARFYQDHPELREEPGAEGDFTRLSALVQLETDRLTAPILRRLEGSIAERQAAVDAVRFLSPALLVDDALTEVAGTGARRHRRFLAQVAAFDATWRDYWLPLVVSSTPVTSSHLAGRPGFAFVEEPASARWGRPLLAVGLLAAASLLLALLARARLRRADSAARGEAP